VGPVEEKREKREVFICATTNPARRKEGPPSPLKGGAFLFRKGWGEDSIIELKIAGSLVSEKMPPRPKKGRENSLAGSAWKRKGEEVLYTPARVQDCPKKGNREILSPSK